MAILSDTDTNTQNLLIQVSSSNHETTRKQVSKASYLLTYL